MQSPDESMKCRDNKDDKTVKDRTMMTRFASQLRRNVERIIAEIGNKCGFKREDVFKI